MQEGERTVFQMRIPTWSFGLAMTLRFIMAYAARRHSSILLFGAAPFQTTALACVAPGAVEVGVGSEGCEEEEASIGSSMVGVASMHHKIESFVYR